MISHTSIKPTKTVYRCGRIIYRSGRETYQPVRARNGAPLYDGFREEYLSRVK